MDTIHITPLYRHRNNQEVNQSEGFKYNVTCRLVSSSSKICYTLPADGSPGSDSDDNGEIEITVEEYHKAGDDYIFHYPGSNGSFLRRRVAIRAYGGKTHRTFSLPLSRNNVTTSYSILQQQQSFLSHPMASYQNDILNLNEQLSQPNILCWTSNQGKHQLCVLALSSQLHIFDVQPTSYDTMLLSHPSEFSENGRDMNNQNSSKDNDVTESGDGHVVSLPFESSSIFSLYDESKPSSKVNCIFLQRAANQDDFILWDKFSYTHYPNVHNKHLNHSANKGNEEDNFSMEEDNEDEMIISDPPNTIRIVEKAIEFPSEAVPSLFSLSNKHDEVKPIVMLPAHNSCDSETNKVHSMIPTAPLFADVYEQILFIGTPKISDSSSDLPPLCVTYHTQRMRHAVWLIKKAPPPPPPTPLWKRTISTKSNDDFYMNFSSTDDSFNINPLDPYLTSSYADDEKKNNDSIGAESQGENDEYLKTPASTYGMSDIYPEFGLSLLWVEETSSYDNTSESPNLQTGRATNIFLASEKSNQSSLTVLCLVCPCVNQNSQIDTFNKTQNEHDKNTSILRCFRVEVSAKCPTSGSQKILELSHLLDLSNILSAQPVISVSKSNIVDILVCKKKNTIHGHKKDSSVAMSLYRANFHICDVNLPFGESYSWNNSENNKKKQSANSKCSGNQISSYPEEIKNVVNISFPLQNRLDLACVSGSSSSQLIDKNSGTCDPFYVRSSLSLSIQSSPLAEEILRSIELSDDIPIEFSLQLRVDCMKVLQAMPNLLLCSESTSISPHDYTDPGWSVVSQIILQIFDAFIEHNTRTLRSKADKSSEEHSLRGSESHKEDGNDIDSDLLWNSFIDSKFHYEYSYENKDLFDFEELLLSSAPSQRKKKNNMLNEGKDEYSLRMEEILSGIKSTNHIAFITKSLCDSIFDSLHFLYEESKLHRNSRGLKWTKPLGQLLISICNKSKIKMNDFRDYYRNDLNMEDNQAPSVGMFPQILRSSYSSFRFSSFKKPPSLFSHIDDILKGSSEKTLNKDIFSNVNRCFEQLSKISRIFSVFSSDNESEKDIDEMIRKRDRKLVLTIVNEGFTELLDLTNELPIGMSLPILESLHRCRNDPPSAAENWPPIAYTLIGRSDLAEMEAIRRGIKKSPGPTSSLARFQGSNPVFTNIESKKNENIFASKNMLEDTEKDGLMPLEMYSSMLFPSDKRMREAVRSLRSSRAILLRVQRSPEVSDHDFEHVKQEKLLLLCRGTLANSVGRGMLTLGTTQPVLAEAFPIPDLCLKGRVPPTNASLALDLNGAPPNMTMWPEFHNGVAAGLRIGLGQKQGVRDNINKITRTWIVYNRSNPQTSNNSAPNQNRNNNANQINNERMNHSHGGFLMALGLQGHLSSLVVTDIYDYLTQGDTTTTVGVLLGMAATKRSTCDPSASKMLCLHIPSLLPPSFAAIEVPSVAQAAAVAGVGLLYQGSSHRLMTEFLLNEIGKRPTSDHSSHDREGYAMLCGISLGMVNLSKATSDDDLTPSRIGGGGLSDLHVEERLSRYILGGRDDFESRSRREAAERANASGAGFSEPEQCSRISEGDSINTDLTAPAATLALGLMYLRTGNKPIVSILNLPDTHFLLDYVRPDLLMLRIISRSLILWDDVEPTAEWIDAQIPDVVQESYDELKSNALRASGFMPNDEDISSADKEQSEADYPVDWRAIRQFYIHTVAGACFGMGLRYAGTANPQAAAAIAERLCEFHKLREENDPVSIARKPERPILEMCLGCIAISLAMVMAGTGDIETMRLLREIRWRCDDEVRYGHHMAYGSALGLLFLGGGSCTLGREPADIAALLLSFFPRYPIDTNDNQFHLQPLRHFYALAVRNNELETIDVDTRKPVFVPIEVSHDTIWHPISILCA